MAAETTQTTIYAISVPETDGVSTIGVLNTNTPKRPFVNSHGLIERGFSAVKASNHTLVLGKGADSMGEGKVAKCFRRKQGDLERRSEVRGQRLMSWNAGFNQLGAWGEPEGSRAPLLRVPQRAPVVFLRKAGRQ
jgi:hypothetical protein